jgi:hypothetical protein
MIDIFVQRGSGDSAGDDIIDPLMSTLAVALQRGRNELDERSSSMQQVSLEIAYRPDVRAGQVGAFLDIQNGLVWFGKISGISHTFDGSSLITTLIVKRPTNFYTG